MDGRRVRVTTFSCSFTHDFCFFCRSPSVPLRLTGAESKLSACEVWRGKFHRLRRIERTHIPRGRIEYLVIGACDPLWCFRVWRDYWRCDAGQAKKPPSPNNGSTDFRGFRQCGLRGPLGSPGAKCDNQVVTDNADTRETGETGETGETKGRAAHFGVHLEWAWLALRLVAITSLAGATVLCTMRDSGS